MDEARWHYTEGDFTETDPDATCYNGFENYTFKNIVISPIGK